MFLAHRIRISDFLFLYPGIENLILPMLSYPGCYMTVVHWLYGNSRDIVVK